jgi:hypothetical protein
MSDRKEIERDQVWVTRGQETVTIAATNPDDMFPVKAETWGTKRTFYVRADGTANPRPGVDDADDLVRRLS